MGLLADERTYNFNFKVVCLARDHFELQGALLYFTVTERLSEAAEGVIAQVYTKTDKYIFSI